MLVHQKPLRIVGVRAGCALLLLHRQFHQLKDLRLLLAYLAQGFIGGLVILGGKRKAHGSIIAFRRLNQA